ncbi:hypothetical protein Sfulv_01100 [Streptomyces fulvorobeus]|uniref:Uncharacterized protein n=1 Tax=Streptomyces fulvorobeus TaxID=284028 RepID=A0A7J0BYI2_9ACTN|nr:hypothetical protein Sfulv_01100 [Streptomyces fulvorobeus]
MSDRPWGLPVPILDALECSRFPPLPFSWLRNGLTAFGSATTSPIVVDDPGGGVTGPEGIDGPLMRGLSTGTLQVRLGLQLRKKSPCLMGSQIRNVFNYRVCTGK